MPRNYKKKGYRKKQSLNMDGEAAEMVVDKNAAVNFQYHEFAKEFVNNGCRKNQAYAVVYNVNPRKCYQQATNLVNKPFIVDLIRAYMVGDHDEPPTKEWAVTEWRKQVECNVLDYIDNDGAFLSVAELRKLPRYAQRAIKSININTSEVIVKMGKKTILDDDGRPMLRRVQHVSIKLIDKQKALADLAKAEKWIDTHMNITVNAPISADQLIEAQMRRQKMLMQENVIEGEAERINDQTDD